MRIISAKFHNVFRFGEEDNYINFDRLYEEAGKDCIALLCGSTDGDENLSNGAGKSSIGEAIYWAFFEKLPRLMRDGSRKGTAVSGIIREADDGTIAATGRAYVEVRFETKDKKVFRLLRGRKIAKSGKQTPILELECETDNDLLSGKKSGPEKALQQILGANHESFLNSVFFAQKDSAKFLSGTDGARRDILMDLRGLQIIDRMLKILREGKKKDCNDLCASLEAKMEVLRGRMADVSLDKLRKIKMEKAAEISDHESSMKKLQEQIDELIGDPVHVEVQEASKRLAALEAELEAMKSERETALTGVNGQIASCKTAKAEVEADIESLKKEKDELEREYASSLDVMKTFSKDDIERRSAAIRDARTIAEEQEDAILELQQKASDIKIREAKLEHETSIIDDDIEKTKLLIPDSGDVGECPTCGSEWDTESISAKISECEKKKRAVATELSDVGSEKAETDKLYRAAQQTMGEARGILEDEPRLARDIEGLKNAKEVVERCKGAAAKVRAREDALGTRLQEATKALSAAGELLQTKGKSYDRRIKEVASDIETCKADHEKARSASREISFRAATIKGQLGHVTESISQLRTDIARIDEKVKIHSKDADDLKRFEGELDAEKKMLVRIQYFDKLLSGDAKNEAAEGCIPLLNLYANDFLSVLRSSMKIEIGSDGKGMPIKLIGGSASTYNMLSGGEQESVRLAVDMALSMLSIGGMSDLPNMIFLDEVFGSLDFTTRENVFALLNRLNRHFDRICVITHDRILQERFVIVVRVDKADGISKIVIDRS